MWNFLVFWSLLIREHFLDFWQEKWLWKILDQYPFVSILLIWSMHECLAYVVMSIGFKAKFDLIKFEDGSSKMEIQTLKCDIPCKDLDPRMSRRTLRRITIPYIRIWPFCQHLNIPIMTSWDSPIPSVKMGWDSGASHEKSLTTLYHRI